MVYPDGKELLHEGFFQGRRQGPLVISDEAGQPVWAAQFDRDVREGYALYFKNGAPWLIEEYAEGRLGAQHLVKESAVFLTLPPNQPHPARETVNTLLERYGAWPQWDAQLKKVESAVERWAKESERNMKAVRSGRPGSDQFTAAQREAVAAIEELRELVLSAAASN
jgi:hypothetical protein